MDHKCGPIKRTLHIVLHILLVLFSVSLVGCQAKDDPFVEVSGVITTNGKPLADASVMFVPIRATNSAGDFNPIAFGITDEEGKYQLSRPGGVTGAFVGMNYVLVSKREPLVLELEDAQQTDDESESAENEEEKLESEMRTVNQLLVRLLAVNASGKQEGRSNAYFVANPHSTLRQPMGEKVFSSFNIQTEITFDVPQQGSTEANFDVGMDPMLKE